MKVRFKTQIEVTVDVSDLLELDGPIDEELAIEAAGQRANEFLQTVWGDGSDVRAAHVGMDALQEAEVIE